MSHARERWPRLSAFLSPFLVPVRPASISVPSPGATMDGGAVAAAAAVEGSSVATGRRLALAVARSFSLPSLSAPSSQPEVSR